MSEPELRPILAGGVLGAVWRPSAPPAAAIAADPCTAIATNDRFASDFGPILRLRLPGRGFGGELVIGGSEEPLVAVIAGEAPPTMARAAFAVASGGPAAVVAGQAQSIGRLPVRLSVPA